MTRPVENNAKGTDDSKLVSAPEEPRQQGRAEWEKPKGLAEAELRDWASDQSIHNSRALQALASDRLRVEAKVGFYRDRAQRSEQVVAPIEKYYMLKEPVSGESVVNIGKLR